MIPDCYASISCDFKIILAARCEFFRGLFESGMKGSQDDEITFDDLPAKEVEEMIKWLYEVHWYLGMGPDPFALYSIADRFLLTDLKDHCEYFIHKSLEKFDPSIVIEALKLTHFYDLPKLFQVCIPIVEAHLTELEAHDDWSLLKELGVVERVLDADKPLKDVEPFLYDIASYRSADIDEKRSQDFKALYAAVVGGSQGFALVMV